MFPDFNFLYHEPCNSISNSKKYITFRLIYVGDGPNDVCPALILNANDLVCPRQGLKMESLLQQYCIQAQIVSWKDGTDILKYI